MTHALRREAPWILWPAAALLDFLFFVLRAAGRLVAGVVGLALIMAGVVVALTIIGAPLGVPMAVLGVLLLIRALF